MKKLLRIKNSDYKILHKKKLFLNDRESLGICDFDHNKIYVVYGLNRQKKKETVFHEALHAISYLNDLKLTERQIEVLAPSIIDMVERNRWDLRK